jgi:transcriptional regulator with XRE-family HTH domain
MALTIDTLRRPPLTPGERLLVARRRRHWSQPQAAHHLGVSRDQYQDWESGKFEIPSAAAQCAISIDHLRDYEVCMLLRRRLGITELEMGRMVGLSRQWVSMIERGAAPAATLVAYWELRGDHA